LEIPLSYENVAQGLQTTLADGDRRPVILAGYSLGGRIALYTSLRFPDFVRALVLESTSPGIADPAARQERVRADEQRAEDIASFGIRAFVDDWYRQPLFRSLHPLLERIRLSSRTMTRPGWQKDPLTQPWRSLRRPAPNSIFPLCFW
jgi:2-succinyl-6-hydroxy-2,4-cyclohexadiene-1-carboxylate synthase